MKTRPITTEERQAVDKVFTAQFEKHALPASSAEAPSSPAGPVSSLCCGLWFGEGWTVEICRERMAICRRAARDYRAMSPSSRYSYRYLNAQFYMQHRDRLAALLLREEESDLGTSLEQSRGRAGYKEEGTALSSSPNGPVRREPDNLNQ